MILLTNATAILLYTGLLFLIISIRKGDRSTYLKFALCSLLFGIQLIFKTISSQQETIHELFPFFKMDVFFSEFKDFELNLQIPLPIFKYNRFKIICV